MWRPMASLLVAGMAGAALTTLPASPAVAASAPPVLTPTHACPSGSVPESWMVDVPSSSPYAADVDCIVWWRVTSGTSAYHFSPGAHVIRGEMSLFVTRLITAAGGTLPAPNGGHFTDDSGTIYQNADNQLYQAGIVSGDSAGAFHPYASVTRGEMAKFLADAYSYLANHGTVSPPPQATSSYFSDVPVGSTFANFIMAAANDGFAGGYADGTYRPATAVSREQMAAFLARMLEAAVTNTGATVPAGPPARAAVATYVADGSQVYLHSLSGSTPDQLLYTAPSGATITTTALSPDTQTVAVGLSVFDANGNATAGNTKVLAVPVAGGTPVNMDPTGALAGDTIDHLSWAVPQEVFAGANSSSTNVFSVLDPTGAHAAQAVTGTLAGQCDWAEMLPNSAVLYSGCAEGVELGSTTGQAYGVVAADPNVVTAFSSADGHQLAMTTLTANSAGTITQTLEVAPAVLGTPVAVTRVTDAAGSSFSLINEVGWQDPGTLLYTVLSAPSANAPQPTGGQIERVAPTANATPQQVTGLQGSKQWGLSVLEQQ